ncbi:hypothetical protein HG536_0B03740 [Torulaspora globosa]|uniref:Uncharacterized protein n=1 Tax=Torulaspora globosa TaxID=48254 RepID=A0A7G3ZDC5_9SACH|nr:uncharacterized protein HG536_0B03740 [Torulaspora globosa]QLL31511.1 hypothetical protein HG536_0B03740 [Torulaspora globosa]
MIGPLTVSQQYLLASKARSKLMKCANAGKNKDYDLRVLVGHANMLDRLMDNIEKFNSKDGGASGSYGAEYISSDEDSDEENRDFSSDSSSEDDSEAEEDDSSDSDYSDSSEREECDERVRYTPLGLARPNGLDAVVTVTIDQCLEDEEEYESDSESDVDEHGFEMDLSMMPLAFKTRDVGMSGQVAIHEPLIV